MLEAFLNGFIISISLLVAIGYLCFDAVSIGVSDVVIETSEG